MSSLAMLGYFAFNINTAPYTQMSESRTYRHARNSIVGGRPRGQYIGEGEETLSLSGILYPEVTGGKSNLYYLERMAKEGNAYTLITEGFKFKGMYVIDQINTTDSHFFKDGVARKIEFTLDLTKTDDKPASLYGDFLELTLNFIAGRL